MFLTFLQPNYFSLILQLSITIAIFGSLFSISAGKIETCRNKDMNCYFWVAEDSSRCSSDEIVSTDCQKACQTCGSEIPPEYDLKKVPESLHKVAFLIGKWRSEFGGKADFPTIPRFTYGEEIDIKLATNMKFPTLNYTAFAWDNSDLVELHSENGFIAGSRNSSRVALNTVMSNGFNTIEEGESKDNSIRFRLRRVGRINFSRDLPVRLMFREWILLNETFLESRLLMATTTHPMMLHTQIIYKRIFP